MTARFVVDLDAFAANLARIREAIAPAEHMLVVKDDAYRHGLEPIVRRAVDEGVRWIGALDVVTGVAARAAAGPEPRIFAWMLAGPEDVRDAIAADLDLGVGTAALLEDVAAVTAADGTVAAVHLKIDTGLHRNGVRPEAWPAFVARAAELERDGRIRVAGIWSHIAEASDEDDDAQRAVFDDAVAQARAAGLTPDRLHLAASAAAFARPEFRYDMARIGAFAYGIRSTDGPSDAELGITPIGSLVADVRRVAPTGAVVDVGFAHGLVTAAAGALAASAPSGPAAVLEVRPESTLVRGWEGAAAGQPVVLFGGSDAESATDLAERIGTIGEEVVLRLSRELPREYR